MDLLQGADLLIMLYSKCFNMFLMRNKVEEYLTKLCEEHGSTIFRLRKNKKSSWYVCELCLKAQWRKSQNKQRQKPEVRVYQREFSNSYNKIKRSLSVYLTMILYAAEIKPE